MKAEAEMLDRPAGIARVFERDGQSAATRDPYVNSMVVEWVGDREVEIKGLSKPMSTAQWRAVCDTIRRMGVDRIWMERRGQRVPLEWDGDSQRHKRSR